MKKPFAVLSSLLLVAPVLFTTPVFAAVNPLNTPYNDGSTPATLYLNGTYQPGSIVDDSAINWTKTANSTPKPDKLHWVDANGKQFWQMTYTKGNVDVTKPDGSVDKENLNQYDDSLTDKNNGYWITSDNYAGANYLDAWIQELNGDPQYINNLKAKSEGTMTFGPDQWPVWNFAALANSSGAVVGGVSGKGNGVQYKVNADGVTATPYLAITDTPPPTSSVTTDKQTYNAGDTVTVTATANVFAANTGYHDEAVFVTGPNGYKKFLNITSGSNGTVQAGTETDTQFPYYGVNDTTVKPVWGGGSGDPSKPTVYNDIATLDTSGLAQGTYTVHYVLYDNVGRASTSSTSGTSGEVTATFTVGPAAATIKFTPPSETVPAGTPVPIGYTTTGFQSGDTVKVTASGNGKNEWNVATDTKDKDFASETETQGVSVNYTATLYDPKGDQLAQDNSTLTWGAAQQNLSLKFAPYKNTTPFGSSPALQVEVTNEGKTDVKTNVTFTVKNNYGCQYWEGKDELTQDHPMTQTVTFPASLPAGKTSTFSIPSVSNPTFESMHEAWVAYYKSKDPNKVAPHFSDPGAGPTYPFSVGSKYVEREVGDGKGGTVTRTFPDTNYNVLVSATVDPDKSIAETTYADNTGTIVLSPTGKQVPVTGTIKPTNTPTYGNGTVISPQGVQYTKGSN